MLSAARIAALFDTCNYSGPVARSIEILVLQPTPFCNINCDYCYLRNRNVHRLMSVDTVKAAVRMVLDFDLVDERLCIVWHAGEPLVLPPSYYETAFDAIERLVRSKCEVSHSFQTNGCLLDDPWCKFLKRQGVRLGLSIDGPAFLHDLHRKTRQGKPTHAQTMCGVHKLREYQIPFHVISVITADALDHPDAIFRFFENLGATEIGFNVEELEGDHASSSLRNEGTSGRIEKFWSRLHQLYKASSGNVQIREFRNAATAILTSRTRQPWQEVAKYNDQVLPFRILSVDCDGRISTFSPELMGTPDTIYGDFVFGNVKQGDLVSILASEHFRRAASHIMDGVRECSRSCEYFSVCGGGAPSNKYFENKSLNSTATMHCQASIQAPLRVVLADLEDTLRVKRIGGGSTRASVPS